MAILAALCVNLRISNAKFKLIGIIHKLQIIIIIIKLNRLLRIQVLANNRSYIFIYSTQFIRQRNLSCA